MFSTRLQREGETIAEYVADLWHISEHCQFGDNLDVMLRDRVMCRIQDGRIQQRLLAESGLTFNKAFEMCQATEMAEKNTQNLRPTTYTAKPSAVMSLHTSAQRNRAQLYAIDVTVTSMPLLIADSRQLNVTSVERKATLRRLVEARQESTSNRRDVNQGRKAFKGQINSLKNLGAN